jgi:phosphohistidine phosphatase
MPLEVYLVRHAIAAERGDEWPDDSKRPLTEQGIARFKEGLKGLAWLDVELDEVLTSPLVRARQTAELLAAGVAGKPVIKVVDSLSPGHTPSAVVSELAKAARRQRVALVGHEPGLGELAAHLLGVRRPVGFKKGGVCRVDLAGFGSRRPGALVWFLTPKILRRLGQ